MRRAKKQPKQLYSGTCKTCGTDFERWEFPSRVAFRGFVAQYCSHDCYKHRGKQEHKQSKEERNERQYEWRKKQRRPFVCQECQTQFERYLSDSEIENGRGKYCSAECYRAGRVNAQPLCRICNSRIPLKSGNKRFCSQECYFAFQKGTRVSRDSTGYRQMWMPEHPSVEGHKTKYVMEHRLVMENMLGRYLYPWERIHHLDGNRSNNDPANLELWIVNQPAGQRVADIYKQDVTRLVHEMNKLLNKLLHENAALKHRLADLEAAHMSK